MNEETKKSKKIESRKDLITFFSKGNLPTQQHFEKLIHSNFNKADDNLDIDNEDGLLLYPAEEGKLLNFYKKKDDETPKYRIRISDEGLGFGQEYEEKEGLENDKRSPEFFIEENKGKKGTGKIGIGTSNPKQQLDVAGIIASKGRVGTIEGYLPADGQWHNVFKKDDLNNDIALNKNGNLIGVNAFEIIAHSRGIVERGKYSLLHAIGTCTYGRSKISKTCSYFGKDNRISIRWVARKSLIEAGNNEDGKAISLFLRMKRWLGFFWQKRELEYNLQLRTMSNYETNPSNETDVLLFYKISTLWNDEFEPRTSEQYDEYVTYVDKISREAVNLNIEKEKQKLKKDQKDLVVGAEKQIKENGKDDNKKMIGVLKEIIDIGKNLEIQRSEHKKVEAKYKKTEISRLEKSLKNIEKERDESFKKLEKIVKQLNDEINSNELQNDESSKSLENSSARDKYERAINILEHIKKSKNELEEHRIDRMKIEKELTEFQKEYILEKLINIKSETISKIEEINKGIEPAEAFENLRDKIEGTIKIINSIDTIKDSRVNKSNEEVKKSYEEGRIKIIEAENNLLKTAEEKLKSMDDLISKVKTNE